jgi:hypothetical protein
LLTWWETKIQQVLKDAKYKKYYESVNLLPAFLGAGIILPTSRKKTRVLQLI